MRVLLSVLLAALFESAASAQALTLERAVALALGRNERALATLEQVKAAHARVEKARAMLFPTISLSGTYTRRQEDVVRDLNGQTVVMQHANGLGAELAVESTVLDARAFPLIREKRAEAASEELAGADVRRRVAFLAADAFMATLGAEQVAAAARRHVDLMRQALADAKARVHADLVGVNDETRAEAELSAATRVAIRAEADVAAARLVLGDVLATDVHEPLEPPDGATVSGDPQVDRLVGEATARREDVAARARDVEALRASAEEPALRLIPSLSLSGHAGATNEAGFGGQTFSWYLQARLSWTAWDGGARTADSDEREALVRAGELDEAAARRAVALEVRTAAAAIDAAQRMLAEAERGAALATKSARESSALYRQGLLPALAVIDSNGRLFDAEVAVVTSRLSLLTASLRLRGALGLMPVEPP